MNSRKPVAQKVKTSMKSKSTNSKKKVTTAVQVPDGKTQEEIVIPSSESLDKSAATEQASRPKADNVLKKINLNPAILLGVAFLLGSAFDYLFWDQLLGINYAIFLLLCVIGGLLVLISNNHKPVFSSLVLIVPLLFFAVFTFLRQEPLTTFLAYTLSLFAIGLFAVTYLGGRWYLYRLSTYFYKFLLLLGDMIGQPLGVFLQARTARLKGDKNERKSVLWGLMRGLAISLPIVLCLGSLLASGDLVFNQKLNDFFEDFTAEKIIENFQRFILIAGCAYLIAGVFLHSSLRSKDDGLILETKSTNKFALGFTETSVILISISILFFLFVVVQFKYFFGGETNIGVAGFTYSQYARRGFNELITVAFISLMIVIGLGGLIRVDNGLQRKIYTGLNTLLIGLVLIILVSAYQRISLGIDWHGYSRLRLYPRIFLVWLAALFVVVAVLITMQQQRFFSLALVLAVFGFAVSVSLFNIDAATVRHNVYRAWHGKNLNVAHLASLSSDAIPALTEEFLSPDLPESTRDGVGAILACYKYFEDNPHIYDYDWRSFNFSYWQAHDALEKVRPYLAGYVIKYDRRPIQVKTPTDALYDCVYNPYADPEEER